MSKTLHCRHSFTLAPDFFHSLASLQSWPSLLTSYLLSVFCFAPAPQEIQQLQQKQQSYVREISDLQETIEWKDKKIGVGLVSSCHVFKVTLSLST